MKLSKSDVFSLIIIIILFISSFYLYPRVPERIPIHWNASGEINGYGPRFVGLFLMPIIALFIGLMFFLIPKIEVYKKNIGDFQKHLDGIKIVFLLFFAGMYAMIIIAIQKPFNISYFIAPALGVLIYYVGWTMQFAKRNFFVGIRTPWTLSSDKVWDKTHKIGSVLFRTVSIFIMIAFVFPRFFFWIFLTPLLGVVIYLYVYSYIEFTKEEKK